MPAGNVGVGDAPERGIFMALEFVANRLADRAVEAVGADNPDRFQRALALERMQSHPDASLLLLETDELGPALDLATKACELVGEDALGLFLGNAEVERKRTVETVEPDGGDLGSAREQVDAANGAPAPQEGVRQPHAGEQLQRAGFHDDRPVPAERLRAAIDQVKRHAAARELDRENQTGRTGADDENGIP
jgi:hypothetical protein